jgi:uncharacterized protein
VPLLLPVNRFAVSANDALPRFGTALRRSLAITSLTFLCRMVPWYRPVTLPGEGAGLPALAAGYAVRRMLEHTFIHIPGIGSTTEQRLWECGVRTWADANGMDGGVPTIRPQVWALLRRWLPASRDALRQKDAAFFGRLCRLGEAWRLFSRFAQDCVYLDIETTGLSPEADDITLVGVYDGETYQAFIAGHNLTALPAYLQHFRLITTFNGAGFDLRFLRVAFPQLTFPPIHIDLRPTTRKLGLTGGLKAIEATLGLQRDPAVRGLSGFDAVLLWRRHLRGDRQALDLLVEYNRADVVHLKTLLDVCYDRLATEASRCFGAPSSAGVPPPMTEALEPPAPRGRGPA